MNKRKNIIYFLISKVSKMKSHMLFYIFDLLTNYSIFRTHSMYFIITTSTVLTPRRREIFPRARRVTRDIL